MDKAAQLKTLAAIARLGTFRAAAEHLNTTQPAISARMRELELQLGTELFRRDGRRMILTARARQLVLETESLLADLDLAMMRAADRAFASGVVRIGTGEIASASCVPDFVQAAQAAFPDLTLEIQVDLTARMLQQLLAGENDIVFLAGPVAHPGIRTLSLGALDLLWLSDPATGARIDRGEAQRIWSLPPHSPLHHIVRDAIAGQTIGCRSLNSCNNVRSMIDIVQRGGCVGLFPETMVRAEIASGALIEVYAKPRRRIEFQAAIRQHEAEPLILRLFDFAAGLDIDPARGRSA